MSDLRNASRRRTAGPNRLLTVLLLFIWGTTPWAAISTSQSGMVGWRLQMGALDCTLERVCRRPMPSGERLVLAWRCAATDTPGPHPEPEWQLIWPGGRALGSVDRTDPEGRHQQVWFDLEGWRVRQPLSARLQLTMDGALISRTITPFGQGAC